MSFEEFMPDNRPQNVNSPAVDLIIHKVTRMASDMDKLAASVEKMSESVQRLALAEERIGQVVASIERLNKRLDDGAERFERNEARLRIIELATVNYDKAERWVERAVVGIVVAVSVFAANKLGLM